MENYIIFVNGIHKCAYFYSGEQIGENSSLAVTEFCRIQLHDPKTPSAYMCITLSAYMCITASSQPVLYLFATCFPYQ